MTITDDGGLPAPLARKVSALCAEFERAWRSNQDPQVERYFRRAPKEVRTHALRELILQEVELRQTAGESVEPEEYLRRFPQYRREVCVAFALAHHDIDLDPNLRDTDLRDTDWVGPGVSDTTDREVIEQLCEEDGISPQRIGRYRVRKRLGQGSFGEVLVARDAELDRLVVLKVAGADRFSSDQERERFVEHARMASRLQHPGIISIHDVLREGQQVIVVQQYVPGRDLATHLTDGPLAPEHAAKLSAAIAESLACAHRAGLAHGGLKPDNILLDELGAPHVSDFGLVDHKSLQPSGRERSLDALAYMSPEQVRAERHRIDARSDIWGLGVIFYQSLVGRRPFEATTVQDLLDSIKHSDPRSPRATRAEIPVELERICLKCLARQRMDRYATAAELARDLSRWLRNHARTEACEPEARRPRIVPRGLRPFGRRDAAFYPELLAGPRDRHGLPECIRFWKTHLDQKDAGHTFALGLLYGPSGCGKTSLVKAGLLPKLAEHVLPIYVQATGGRIKAALFKELRRACPEAPVKLSLVELLAALRDGVWIPPDKKIVIILDQFEQWLHAGHDPANAPLVDALRHCDGGRVQCLIVVRDAGWSAITRLFHALDLRLAEGKNCLPVDLFDEAHATKVLSLFGHAYERLPGNMGHLSSEQRDFLRQAVALLTHEGAVIPVHLALLADMIKRSPWTSATLKGVGESSELGQTFLSEMVGADSTSALRAGHQPAVQRVLAALLPDEDSDMTGGCRSYEELLAASGYVHHRDQFDEVIHILDEELRIITPAHPVRSEAEPPAPPDASGRYYQLTHDYLVSPLRIWLRKRQCETRRGRAELNLAERTARWSIKPEDRFLPNWWEYLRLYVLTQPSRWTNAERKMMAKSGRRHARRSLTFLMLAILIGWTAYESYGRWRAAAATDAVATASLADLPAAVDHVTRYRRWSTRRLHAMAASDDPEQHLRASLALAATEPGQVDYLLQRLLAAAPEQVSVIRLALVPYRTALSDQLWKTLKKGDSLDGEQRLRAAGALAALDQTGDRWREAAPDVVAQLVRVRPAQLAAWQRVLAPVGTFLAPSLCQACRDPELTATQRAAATDLLATYAESNPALLAEALQNADEEQFQVFLPLARRAAPQVTPILETGLTDGTDLDWQDESAGSPSRSESIDLARRRANAAVALLELGAAENAWSAFQLSRDPTARSRLIHRLRPLHVDPHLIVTRLRQDINVSCRRALLLALGDYEPDAVAEVQRASWLAMVRDLYEHHPDPGVHASAQWLLDRWGWRQDVITTQRSLAETEDQLARRGPDDTRQWYVTTEGHTMVLIQGRPFTMGSPSTEPGRRPNETLRRCNLTHRFALASTEVTRGQYRVFQEQSQDDQVDLVAHPQLQEFVRTDDSPIVGVTWYEAAAYCNWLSEREGVPRDQWCYERNADGRFAAGMRLKPNYLELRGYRLPTEAEWEFACRAGSSTMRYFGQDSELLPMYAWYQETSQNHTWPVAMLKPNDLGLFDMHGNTWDWTNDSYIEAAQSGGPSAAETTRTTGAQGVLRGGAFFSLAPAVRTAVRYVYPIDKRGSLNGFRVARSYP